MVTTDVAAIISVTVVVGTTFETTEVWPKLVVIGTAVATELKTVLPAASVARVLPRTDVTGATTEVTTPLLVTTLTTVVTTPMPSGTADTGTPSNAATPSRHACI